VMDLGPEHSAVGSGRVQAVALGEPVLEAARPGSFSLPDNRSLR
jgi:hypothetical protein